MAKLKVHYPLVIKNLQVKRSKEFELYIAQLTLKKGELVCITGANGSGKTTFVETITGLIQPTSGKIWIQNKPISSTNVELKKHIGFIPDDESWFIAELTASEYFSLLVSIYDSAGLAKAKIELRCHELAKKLGFNSFSQQLGSLSHGNKKKVQIIAGLMHNPAILIIDELRNGLDPVSIYSAEQLINSVSKQGTTILAATHDLWWAERVADKIVMISNGSVVFEDTTSKIKNKWGSLEARFIEEYEQIANK